MLKDGLSKSAIARKLGISRDTVAKYAKLPEGYIPVIKREPVATTVDPYLPHIARMLEEAQKLEIHNKSRLHYWQKSSLTCILCLSLIMESIQQKLQIKV